MSKQLPDRPNLDHLRKQAKDLLRSFRAGDEQAALRFKEHLPGYSDLRADPKLHDAQSALAREYGFPSWAKLVEHVEKRLANLGLLDNAATVLTKAAFTDKVHLFVDAVNSQPGLARLDLPTALAWGETERVRELIHSVPLDRKMGPRDMIPLEYVAYSRVHQADPNRYEGLLQCARILLDLGADPNAAHDYEGAPIPVLYRASSESGHVGITRLLLERGAKPNDGESVYHAAQFNRREILEVLVEFGADVSNPDLHWGNTPLGFNLGHRPSDSGHATAMKGVEWLLEHGADPNVPSGKSGESILHIACMTGQPARVFEMLLKHGADPNKEIMGGHNPYEVAVALGNPAAAEVIARYGGETQLSPKARFLAEIAAGKPPSQPSEFNNLTAFDHQVLHKLAEHGNVAGVARALEAGFDINLRGFHHGETPLHQASYCGRAEVVAFLIERGADLTVRDTVYNAPAFGWAVHATMFNRNPDGDYVRIVQDLVKAGSTPELAREIAESKEAPEDIRTAILEVLE